MNGHVESHFDKHTGKWSEPEFVTDPYLKIHGLSPALNYGMLSSQHLNLGDQPLIHYVILQPNRPSKA